MTNHSFDNQMSPETYLCHGPFDPEVFGGVVNPPVYHASTVIFKNCKELNERHQALFEDAEDEVMYYGRFGTPITFAVQKALAELEGGYRSLLVPTGLAACTSALLALVKSGDHILVSSSVYGPTRGFVNNVLAKMGVSATFFDPTIGDGIGQLFQENTTVVFTESPGSQTFDIQDIPAITRVAHAHNAKVIIDNTWATPLFFKPFEHGVDVSVHAATKYIVGHSDAQMGLITTNKETWLAIRRFIYLFGLHAAPDDVYLAQRGLRTMSLRLGRHQDSALKIAKWFEEREEVEQVLHPALPSCRGTKFGNVTSPVPAVCLAWCLNRTTQKSLWRSLLIACSISALVFRGAVLKAWPFHLTRVKIVRNITGRTKGTPSVYKSA